MPLYPFLIDLIQGGKLPPDGERTRRHRGCDLRAAKAIFPVMETTTSGKQPRQNITVARFRLWRQCSLPRASYQITPRFSTPDDLRSAAGLKDWQRRAAKSFSPSLTGLAYTPRRLYLVVAAGAANYEHVAKLVHCRALMRADPDYQEHRGKRVSMLVLCDDCPAAVADFARRHRVRVVSLSAGLAAKVPPKVPLADPAASAAGCPEVTKPLSP